MNLFYRMSFLLITATMAVSVFSEAMATDLSVKEVVFDKKWVYAGADLGFTLLVGNNNVLAAPNYNVKVDMKDQFSNEIVFSDTYSGKNLQPFTDTTMEFSVKVDFMDYGKLGINIEIEFADEINPDNNTWEGETNIYVNRSIASSRMINFISANLMYKDDFSYLSMPYDVTEEGSEIQFEFDSDKTKLALDGDYWLGWVNFDKYSRYSGNNAYILLDPLTMEIDYGETGGRPEINGGDGGFEPENPEFYVDGSANVVSEDSDGNSISNNTEPAGAPKTCAILVGGIDEDSETQQESFDYDVDLMRSNLMNESFGPRLSADNMKVIKQADSAKIARALDSLSEGGYSKVIFFYSGHGSKYSALSPDSTLGISYYDLFNELIDSGADSICVIVDACYSGKVVEIAKEKFNLQDKYYEVIASSDTNKTARNMRLRAGNELQPVGAFTWFFALCYGEPDADADNNGKTSLTEAAEWVEKQSPSLPSGRKLDTLQRPIRVINIPLPPLPPMEEVEEKIVDDVKKEFGAEIKSEVSLYVDTTLYYSGTKFAAFDTTEYIHYLDSEKYFAWIDWKPYAKFGHQSTYIYIDPYDLNNIEYDTTAWFPVINDSIYVWDTNRVVWGQKPAFQIDFDQSFLDNSTEDSVQADSTCAILVGGTDDRPWMQEAFNWDIDIYKWLLTKNPKGPQLPESSIVAMKYATLSDLVFKFVEMRGKYKKVYFMYAGHGAEWGALMLNYGISLSYENLFEHLYKIGAEDLCVFIESCNAGLAREAMENGEGYNSTNVELITSSNSEKPSYASYIENEDGEKLGYSYYTRSFAFCSADIAADMDGDEKVGWGEAFDWIISENPAPDVGGVRRRLDTLQRPTKTVSRTAEIPAGQTAANEFNWADISITPELQLNERFELKLGIKYDYNLWNPENKNIIMISPYRYWGISAENSLNLNFELQFNYREWLDTLPVQDNESIFRAALKREGPEDIWKIYTPSFYDETRKTITAKNVSDFSEWALAAVKINPNSVGEENPLTQVNFIGAYPNPASGAAALRFYVSNPGLVLINIYDNYGRIIETPVNSRLDSGEYTVVINAARYAPGAYFARIQSGGASSAAKFIVSGR